MIYVSEKPIFDDFRPIPIGGVVSIIEKKYVTFNPVTFREEVLECEEPRFKHGTLIYKTEDLFRITYGIQIHIDNAIITFEESPRKYFFKKNNINKQTFISAFVFSS